MEPIRVHVSAVRTHRRMIELLSRAGYGVWTEPSRAQRFSVVVTDVTGLTTLGEELEEARLIIVVDGPDDPALDGAWDGDVAAVVCWEDGDEEWGAAVAAACAEEHWISPSLAGWFLDRARSTPSPPACLELLTPREATVAELLIAGMSNAEIAARLYLAPNTVKEYARSVFRKFDCRDRFGFMAMLLAHAYGIPLSNLAREINPSSDGYR